MFNRKPRTMTALDLPRAIFGVWDEPGFSG
jgi:hypothetical protein